jgi:hypothetical protein
MNRLKKGHVPVIVREKGVGGAHFGE